MKITGWSRKVLDNKVVNKNSSWKELPCRPCLTRTNSICYQQVFEVSSIRQRDTKFTLIVQIMKIITSYNYKTVTATSEKTKKLLYSKTENTLTRRFEQYLEAPWIVISDLKFGIHTFIIGSRNINSSTLKNPPGETSW